MSEWKEYKLSEVAEVNKRSVGKNYPFQIIEYIDTASVTENKFEETPIIKLSEAPSRAKRLVKIGDTILSTVRPIQKHYAYIKTVKPNTVVSTGFAVVTPLKIDSKFLYYFLTQEEITTYLNTIAEGGTTTFPAFRADELKDLIIYAPMDINEQTAIAEILSSLDDKIELNNQINKDLEALAQALFKQWFIDFDFPNENGEPYRSSGGEMVDSELGEIPKGWPLVKISSLNPTLQTGKRPKGGVNGIEKGMPSVGAESIKGVGYFDFSKTKFVPLDFAKSMKRGIIKGFELLIYKDGGKPGTFIPHFSIFGEGFPFEEFVINEHIFSLDFDDYNFNSFCYYFFDSNYVKPILENSGGKAAIPGINQSDINNLWVFSPDNELVKLFGMIAKETISTILINCKENISLSKLRDTLLPKLISGELKVTNNSIEV
jgi:type I restriction enzyme S subunit